MSSGCTQRVVKVDTPLSAYLRVDCDVEAASDIARVAKLAVHTSVERNAKSPFCYTRTPEPGETRWGNGSLAMAKICAVAIRSCHGCQ